MKLGNLLSSSASRQGLQGLLNFFLGGLFQSYFNFESGKYDNEERSRSSFLVVRFQNTENAFSVSGRRKIDLITLNVKKR